MIHSGLHFILNKISLSTTWRPLDGEVEIGPGRPSQPAGRSSKLFRNLDLQNVVTQESNTNSHP